MYYICIPNLLVLRAEVRQISQEHHDNTVALAIIPNPECLKQDFVSFSDVLRIIVLCSDPDRTSEVTKVKVVARISVIPIKYLKLKEYWC